jgi:hypothetical protein
MMRSPIALADVVQLRLHDATRVADGHLVLAVPYREGTQPSPAHLSR